ncbi:MAG TPA: cytochrome c biogenesis protein CcsA [Opitutaceae bacterium]
MKRLIPLLVLALGALYLASTFFPRKPQSEFDLEGFGRLPVLVNGRVKPLDTVARTSLLMMQGRQRFKAPNGETLSPQEWLLDVVFRANVADNYQHFEIVHPELLDLFGLRPEDGAGKKRFSFAQLHAKLPELQRQTELAEQTESAARNSFQRAVINLFQHVMQYHRLKYSLTSPDSENFLADLTKFQSDLAKGVEAVRAKQAGQPHDETIATTVMNAARSFDFMAQVGFLLAIPPAPDNANLDDWKTVGGALLASFETGQVEPHALAYAGLGYAWRMQQPEQFNTIVKLYRDQLGQRFDSRMTKSDAEARFNAAAPFGTATITIYVLALLLAVFSWLKWPEVLQKSSLYLLGFAWIVTTVGIATRMWLEGRPPVTNLYSSALFIGWAAVLLCLALEFFFRNAVGSAAGGVIGFCTLLIAHHLSLSGDTLEMMRAVLDSNFWLATHVVTITIGYSATYLAGFLAIVYIFRGLLTRSLDKATADALTRMVYGIVCFATLFSLVGTILGGIWADQSWGRFWGWDPKENGALLIVIWNAIILHARWGGMIKQRGLMSLAVAGNIVTSWSWFGTNMLGVGLHSYGFMDAAFWWLTGFVGSQLLIIGLASLPLELWRSFRGAETPARRAEPAVSSAS